ncbi:MAG: GNAT family N-acetyltransferase [Pseudomonadota bacterium]
MTEAATLDALHTRAFGHPGAHGWREADFERALKGETHDLVWTDDGYAMARTTLDEAELLLIATVPERRRRGVATRMLSLLERRLKGRGVTRLFLEVVETNFPALTFYEKHGFKRSGHREGYYGRGAGHGAVLLDKALN